ncbi:hypothetical protein V8F20_009412 [Naviculisporaceae sp. PSN 640]
MRHTISLSFALLLASGLFLSGSIAVPHGTSQTNLVQRDNNLVNKRLPGNMATINQAPDQTRRSPEIADDTGILTVLKRFVDTVFGRDVSGDNAQAALDTALKRKAMVMGRQFTNETTPTNETVAEPVVVLARDGTSTSAAGKRDSVVRTTVLFPRQFINETTPTNQTVTEPEVVLRREEGSASAPKTKPLAVRTAVLLGRQFTNGTGNDTEIVVSKRETKGGAVLYT